MRINVSRRPIVQIKNDCDDDVQQIDDNDLYTFLPSVFFTYLSLSWRSARAATWCRQTEELVDVNLESFVNMSSLTLIALKHSVHRSVGQSNSVFLLFLIVDRATLHPVFSAVSCNIQQHQSLNSVIVVRLGIPSPFIIITYYISCSPYTSSVFHQNCLRCWRTPISYSYINVHLIYIVIHLDSLFG